MKTKYGKDIDSVDNGGKLHAWMQEAGDQIDRLTEDVAAQASFTQINKGAWRETDEKRVLDEQFGKFMGALKKGDRASILKMGGVQTQWSTPDQDIKAISGSPLTGDASSTDAQYLVPQRLYIDDILRFPNYQSGLIQSVRRIPMQARQIRVACESTEPTMVHVTNEITSKSEMNPTWTNVDLTAETFAYWVAATEELVEDSFVDVGGELRKQAMQAYITILENQILNGNTDPFVGLLNNTSTVSEVMETNAFADIAWSDLLNMMDALTTARKRSGAAYCMNPTLWSQLISQQDAQGRYYYDPSLGPTNFKCWGSPLILTDNMPTLSETDSSKAFILYGNFNWHLLGTRIGLEARFFPDTVHAAQDDEVFYRFRTRFASIVGLPAGFVKLVTSA